MAQLFVSFSPSDRQIVERIVTRLQRGGHHVITDSGQTPMGVVLQQVATCDAFLYILSPASVNSPSCKAALDEAIHQNKPIVPVNINPHTPHLPSLAPYQGVNLAAGISDEGAALLLKVVRRATGSGGAGTSLVGAIFEFFMVALLVAAVLLGSYVALGRGENGNNVEPLPDSTESANLDATFAPITETAEALQATLLAGTPVIDLTPPTLVDDVSITLTAAAEQLAGVTQVAQGSEIPPVTLPTQPEVAGITETFESIQATLSAVPNNVAQTTPSGPDVVIATTAAPTNTEPPEPTATDEAQLPSTTPEIQPSNTEAPTATTAPSETPVLPTETPTEAPTDTPPPPSNTPVPSATPTVAFTNTPEPVAVDLILNYDAQNLLIYNASGETLDITGMEFVLPDDSDHFDARYLGAQTLRTFEAGECLQIVLNNRAPQPTENCSDIDINSFGRKVQFSYYWVWDSEVNNFGFFHVTLHEDIIAICQLVDGTCGVSLTGATMATPTPIAISGLSNEFEIAFTSERDGNPEIYVLNPTSLEVLRLTDDPAADRMPVWSPDGSAIAFVSERDGNPEIYVMASDGTNVRRVTDNAAQDLQPSWSPNGQEIAFQSDRDGDWNIYAVAVDGSRFRQITFDGADDESPSWSPLKNEILFMTNRHGDWELYAAVLVRTDVELTRLTSSAAAHQYPSWSPTSTQFAFESDRDGNPEIYIININNDQEVSNLRRLTNDASRDGDPSWGQGGIVYVSDREGGLNIYAINTDSSNERRLTDDEADDYDPDWR